MIIRNRGGFLAPMPISRALRHGLLALSIGTLVIGTVVTNTANGEFYINELLSDPGGSGDDARDAYVELRGTAGASLENMYLLIVEAEDQPSHAGTAGVIENMFCLGDDPLTPAVEVPYTMGTNGFLTIRQNGNTYPTPAAGTTDLVNSGGGPGFGSNGTGGLGTSIRARDIGNQGEFEGGGYTLMLIKNNGGVVPALNMDLDVGNNGLDHPDGKAGWEIVDSIGFFGEYGEALYGRLYGKVNFGQEFVGEPIDVGLEDPIIFETPNIEPGTSYFGIGYEIEYLGRWGNSTGSTYNDWHISNVTDNPTSGSTGTNDWHQSGGFHDDAESDLYVQTTQGVAYGTAMTNTFGAPNLFYLDGDFDLDGYVDGRDFLTWQRNYGYGDGLALGTTVQSTTALRTDGDTNGDWKVDGLDLVDWQANYGASSSLLANAMAVPEPTAIIIMMPLVCCLITHRRRNAT